MILFHQLKKAKKLDWPFYLASLGLLIGALVLLVALLVVSLKDVKVGSQLNEELDHIDNYTNSFKKTNPPSSEKLMYLKKNLERLKTIYTSMNQDILYEDLMSPESLREESALEFKEKLFEAKQRLQEKAATRKINFPQVYGLEGYEAKLPSDEELPQLFYMLELTEDLIGTILKLPINRFNELSFKNIFQEPISPKDTREYKEYVIHLHVESDYTFVSELFKELTQKSYFIRPSLLQVRDLTGDLGEDHVGPQEIKIDLIVFKLVPEKKS